MDRDQYLLDLAAQAGQNFIHSMQMEAGVRLLLREVAALRAEVRGGSLEQHHAEIASELQQAMQQVEETSRVGFARAHDSRLPPTQTDDRL